MAPSDKSEGARISFKTRWLKVAGSLFVLGSLTLALLIGTVVLGA